MKKTVILILGAAAALGAAAYALWNYFGTERPKDVLSEYVSCIEKVKRRFQKRSLYREIKRFIRGSGLKI